MSEQRKPEELRVQGSQLVERIRDLIHEGNVRRLQIRYEGRTIFEIPLTVAAVGVLVAPMLAAIGAFAALAAECTLVVERAEGKLAGTAGDTWPELSPGAAGELPSPLQGSTSGMPEMELGEMAAGGQGIAPDLPEAPDMPELPSEPPTAPDMPEAPGEPGQR